MTDYKALIERLRQYHADGFDMVGLCLEAADALEALLREREWQPIDTAPRTTSPEIIGCVYSKGVMTKEPFISFWSPTLGKFFATPTHWQPLPPPPDKEPT